MTRPRIILFVLLIIVGCEIIFADDFRCAVGEYHNYYNYHNRQFAQTCIWTNLNSTVHTVFNFETNPTTTTIYAINCNLEAIPYGLFSKFSALKIINFQKASIPAIETNDFRGAQHLTTVNMTHNCIQKLGKNLFSHAPSLQFIDLSWNNITEIAKETFESNDALAHIILNNNRIKVFDCILGDQLLVLGLQHNQLHTFRPITMSKATTIQLSYNNLTSVADATAMYNNSQILDVSNNPMNCNETITGVTELGLANTSATIVYIDHLLAMLDASNNQITNVVVLNISAVNLSTLCLAHNKLTSISNLTCLTRLRHLDLSFNTIADINLETFSNMTQLETLNLEASGIVTLKYGIFAHQTRLSNLDLSYNHLKHVNLKVLSFLSQLTTLFLDGNDLTSLDINDFRLMMPNLNTIGISDNRFNCSFLTSAITLLRGRGVQVQIDESVKVKNQSNVIGIPCSDQENSTWTIPFIHRMNGTENIESIHSSIEQFPELKVSMQDMQDKIAALEIWANRMSESASKDENNTASNAKLQEMLRVINKTNADRFTEMSNRIQNLTERLKSVSSVVNVTNVNGFSDMSDRVLMLSQRISSLSQNMSKIMIEVNDLKAKLDGFGATQTEHPIKEALSLSDNSSAKIVESNVAFVKSLLIGCFVLLLCIVTGMLVMVLNRYRVNLRQRFHRPASVSNAVIFDRDASSMM